MVHPVPAACAFAHVAIETPKLAVFYRIPLRRSPGWGSLCSTKGAGRADRVRGPAIRNKPDRSMVAG
jgi:hypothetical protein